MSFKLGKRTGVQTEKEDKDQKKAQRCNPDLTAFPPSMYRTKSVSNTAK